MPNQRIRLLSKSILKIICMAKVWRRTGRLVKYYKRSCIFEPPNNSVFLIHRLFTSSLKANVYLVGYWQTEKYFTSIENIIRNDFILKDAADEVNRKMLAEIDSYFSSSVCIHVRHGDNATPKASKTWYFAIKLLPQSHSRFSPNC